MLSLIKYIYLFNQSNEVLSYFNCIWCEIQMLEYLYGGKDESLFHWLIRFLPTSIISYHNIIYDRRGSCVSQIFQIEINYCLLYHISVSAENHSHITKTSVLLYMWYCFIVIFECKYSTVATNHFIRGFQSKRQIISTTSTTTKKPQTLRCYKTIRLTSVDHLNTSNKLATNEWLLLLFFYSNLFAIIICTYFHRIRQKQPKLLPFGTSPAYDTVILHKLLRTAN